MSVPSVWVPRCGPSASNGERWCTRNGAPVEIDGAGNDGLVSCRQWCQYGLIGPRVVDRKVGVPRAVLVEVLSNWTESLMSRRRRSSFGSGPIVVRRRHPR